jgi:hypothetical protein
MIECRRRFLPGDLFIRRDIQSGLLLPLLEDIAISPRYPQRLGRGANEIRDAKRPIKERARPLALRATNLRELLPDFALALGQLLRDLNLRHYK